MDDHRVGRETTVCRGDCYVVFAWRNCRSDADIKKREALGKCLIDYD